LPLNMEIFIWIKNNIYLTNCVISLLELSKPIDFHAQYYQRQQITYDYNSHIEYYSESESDQYFSPDEELSSNSPPTT
jgi:hypothetical protein